MRFFAILFSVVIVAISYQTTLGQSKSKTVEWVNTRGEELLRDITGNSSIQWQMDEYGRLKVTNYKTKKEGESSIIKRYSYLNLYELNWKEGLTGKFKKSEGENRLLLQCKAQKKACIKSRHYTTATNFKTIATPTLRFPLQEKFNDKHAERLEKVLIHAIKLFQENN